MSSLSLVRIFWQCHNQKRQSKEDNCVKHKPKCRRTTIVRDTWDETIHKAKGNWIRDQKEDECRVKRKLYFQTSR